jgi:SAM-dependent methyltransferase
MPHPTTRQTPSTSTTAPTATMLQMSIVRSVSPPMVKISARRGGSRTKSLARFLRRCSSRPASRVLEIGCGSGGYALEVASVAGCSIVGVDINDAGVRNANMLTRARHLADRASFQHCDVSKTLPFPDAAFDAAFANDVLCHIPGRPALLEEAFRVLKPSARLLFSDALIIGGGLSQRFRYCGCGEKGRIGVLPLDRASIG